MYLKSITCFGTADDWPTSSPEISPIALLIFTGVKKSKIRHHFRLWGALVSKQRNISEINLKQIRKRRWWLHVLPKCGLVLFPYLWEPLSHCGPEIRILTSSALLSEPAQRHPPKVYQSLGRRLNLKNWLTIFSLSLP